MTEIKQYFPGTFCWVDLATTDATAAKRFYTELFGWRASDLPAGDGLVYTLFDKQGKHVCALYQMSGDKQARGLPARWASYLSVANADDSAARAEALGGKVLEVPFDVKDVGRMAVLRDPAGAVFSVWEPKTYIGAQLVNEPGALCWNELHTNEMDTAAGFYTSLFGWNVKDGTQVVGEEYIAFFNQDRPAGGMLKIKPEWGQVPPYWSVYFAVDHCDRLVEQALGLGARLEVSATDVKGVGRFAVLKDPQGAYFAVIQLAEGVV